MDSTRREPYTADPLDSLETVTLDQMGAAKLMRRVDTKFLANAACLDELFRLASPHYRVVVVDSLRRQPYYTRYFDTPSLEMYHDHRRGRKARQKVRIRAYESGATLAFIEVKDKNNKGVTSKKRRQLSTAGLGEHAAFIAGHSRYTLDRLSPQIENRFLRVTLVKNDFTERVTIDTCLRFNNLVTGIADSLPHIAVIEWKRDPRAQASPMRGILKRLGIRPSGFSKYCVGMARTNPALRQNRFKARNRAIARLAN